VPLEGGGSVPLEGGGSVPLGGGAVPLDGGDAILRGMPPTLRDWLGAFLLTAFLVALVVIAVRAAIPA
jgi:hypothetical protein